MATRTWRGTAANVRGTYTITIANTWAQGDTVTITIDNITFVITIGTLVTTDQVATTIRQALSGNTLTDTAASCTISVAEGGARRIPQFAEFTATVSSSVVTLTGEGSNPAGLAGRPFTLATGEVGSTAGSGTATVAAVVTPTGQFHWNQQDNWSGNTVPVDNDTVVFDDGAVDLRYNLTTSLQLAALVKTKKYTGNVGLPLTNLDNSGMPYSEYRTPRYLTTDDNSVVCTASLEAGAGQGSGRFMWDYGAGETNVTVYGRGARADTGVPSILLKGSHASNTLTNLAGDVGVAFFAGETATIATLVTGDGPTSQAETWCGSGVTLTTVEVNGGKLSTNSAMTTGTQYGGEWDHYTGTITTLTINGGTFTPRGACTITTAVVHGKIDLSKVGGQVTFTNLVNLYGEAEIYDPNNRAVFTAGYKLNSTKAKVVRAAGDIHSLS